jgi:vitamin B12 transporter
MIQLSVAFHGLSLACDWYTLIFLLSFFMDRALFGIRKRFEIFRSMRTIFALSSLFIVATLSGQSLHSGDTLSEAVVATPLIFTELPGLKTSKMNPSVAPFSDVSRMLSEQSPVFVRHYGPGNLSTTSFRGGHASHTAILWNGLPINSGFNGMLDLSLLPVQAFENMSFQSGGGAALWGSGAVGGSIMLDNLPMFNASNRIGVSLIGGSFGRIGQTVSGNFSKERIAANIQASGLWAHNQYSYRNTHLVAGGLSQMPDMQMTQYLLSGNLHQRTGKTGLLSASFWLQNNSRNLQPTILQPASSANQIDQAARLGINWNGHSGPIRLLVRTGAFYENLVYKDSLSQIHSDNRLKTFIQQVQGAYEWRNWLLTMGGNFEYRQAAAVSLGANPQQSQLAFLISPAYRFSNNKGAIRLNLRQEWVDGEAIPVVCALGFERRVAKWIQVRAQASSVYRVPTLNDRFWIPGGNQELLPESGFTYEAGIEAEGRLRKLQISGSTTAFSRRMNNWIMWQPNGFFWEPKNLLEVWSRGLESRVELNWNKQQHRVQLVCNTNYVLSTNEKQMFSNDLSVGKQLIYVPLYNGNLIFGYQYQHLGIRWIQQYIGYRYTTTDHSHFLPPVHLSALQIDFNWEQSRYVGTTFFRINNIFNRTVEMMAFRPLPLLSWEAGITFQFLIKSKSNV